MARYLDSKQEVTMAKANILVVDDEAGVRDMLADALRMQQYAVATAVDFDPCFLLASRSRRNSGGGR